MRSQRAVWNEYLYSLQDLAFQQFGETDAFKALRQKSDQMESDCKNNFSEDDFTYIEAWVEAITELNSAESVFMYERAYRDCIGLLKALRVIG